MSFYVGTGYFPAYISSEKINNILDIGNAPGNEFVGEDKGFFLLNASGRSAGVYLSTLPSARPNDPRAGKGRF